MDAKEALSRAASYCSVQERCISDVERKLRDWDVAPEKFGAIIERLLKEKFIDERRYAMFYARDKFKFNGWGRIKIRWTLKQKNIAEEVISNALGKITEDDYINKLQDILQNKYRQLKGRESNKAKAALIRFARSRGFEQELIYPVVNKLMN